MYTESNPWLVFCYCVDFTKTSQGLHSDSKYQLLVKELLKIYIITKNIIRFDLVQFESQVSKAKT